MPINHKVNSSKNKKIVTDASVIVKSLAAILTKYIKESIAKQADATEKLINEEASALSTGAAANLKVFRENNKALIPNYLNLVEKNLRQFKPPVNIQIEVEEFDEDLISLELFDNEEVEEKIAIEGIVARAEGSFYEVLYGLNKRLAVLLNVDELTNASNPVAPEMLVSSYIELLDSYAYSIEIRLIHFSSFESSVMQSLEVLYKDINKLCIDGGVLPRLPKQKISKENGSYSAPAETAHEASVSPSVTEARPQELAQGQPAYRQAGGLPAELYSSLIEIANAQRIRTTVDAQVTGPAVVGEQIPTEQLLSSLTKMQKIVPSNDAGAPMTLRTKIADGIQVDGQRQPYLDNDEILIDVVAMFFDVMLQDKHLPNTVRLLLAKLQIPVLKVSMIDKDFFAKKSHPARRFLNDLSQAGLGIGKQNNNFRSHVFKKMESLVERVLMEFECDIEIFSELCVEFANFMEHQQRQIELIEERSRKVTQSSEKVDLARRQAGYEISVRLQGLSFPEFVRDFLEDVWKDVVVLAILRQERDPKTLTGCLAVVDKLMASVVPISTEDAAKRKSVISSLPGLLKDMKVGLENISYDFHEALPWFKELEAWHREVLLKPIEKVTNHVASVKLVEVEGNRLDLEADLLMELEQEMAEMPQDAFTDQVTKMLVGDWVEYQAEEGGSLRAKLSWKSTVTLQCLFVNEMGAKALDLSLTELAESLREGKMLLVEPEQGPLVERVVASMKGFMGDVDAQAAHG